MSYLIDTDCLSLLRRKGKSRKLEAFVQANEEDIFVSVVSWAEIAHGAAVAADPDFKAELEAWLAHTRESLAGATEPLEEPVLRRWKQLLSELKVKNRTMTCEDSLIAATALHHGHTVVTRNVSHFKPAGVEVLDPTV
jgi:predicted nucleic acid-binding protein